MNVRFHHVRIGTHFLNGVGLEEVTFPADRSADLLNRHWPKQTEVIVNRFVMKFGFLRNRPVP